MKKKIIEDKNKNNKDILPHLCKYVQNTKNDWNYITPYDFYHKYYSKPDKMKNIYLIDLRKKEISGAQKNFILKVLKISFG